MREQVMQADRRYVVTQHHQQHTRLAIGEAEFVWVKRPIGVRPPLAVAKGIVAMHDWAAFAGSLAGRVRKKEPQMCGRARRRPATKVCA